MISTITIKSSGREQMIDVTGNVRKIVSESGIEEGIAVVYNRHTTAAVIINEGADPSVQNDILKALAKHFPLHGDYSHAEGNSDAHIKSALIGSDRVIPIKKGELVLGTWQRIFFCEFDGPRSREIIIAVI